MSKERRIHSSTGWEKSFYGGVQRLLWDLQDLNIPYGFHIDDSDSVEYLTYYQKKKLLGYFLKELRDLGFLPMLLRDLKLKKVERVYYGNTHTETHLYTSKNSIKAALSKIIAKRGEMSPLFLKYTNYLSNCDIYFDVPDRDKEKIEKGPPSEAYAYLSEKIDQIKAQEMYVYREFGSSLTTDETINKLKEKTKFKYVDEDKEIIYTDEETNIASKFLNLLDISFDSSEQKISNLRSGKIDANKIVEAVMGKNLIYYRKEIIERTKPFAVCILNDESGSMTSRLRGSKYTKIEFQHSITKALYNAFSQILPSEDIYVYGHTGNDDPIIRVYQDKYSSNFEKTYRSQLEKPFLDNYDGPVIENIYNKIRSQTDKSILFINLSDGSPFGTNYGGEPAIDHLKKVVEKCKRDNFVTCGIFIDYPGYKHLYNYHVIVNNYKDAPKLITTLLNKAVKTEFQ